MADNLSIGAIGLSMERDDNSISGQISMWAGGRFEFEETSFTSMIPWRWQWHSVTCNPNTTRRIEIEKSMPVDWLAPQIARVLHSGEVIC